MIEKIERGINKIGKKQEFILVCVLSGLFVFGIMLAMGTMTCGWHLTDDHEFLDILYQVKAAGRSFWDMAVEYTSRDISFRFRPIYMPTRVFSVWMFGENLLLYYIMKALETFISCIFLYYVGKGVGNSKLAAFLFALVSLIGYQSVAWWKLGTHEMQGVLLLSISLLTLQWWMKTGKRIWEIISIIGAILMMLYKESFLALAPFVMLFTVYYDFLINKAEKTWENLWETIKKRISYLLAIGVAFALLAGYFVFGIGIGGYHMSGDGTGGLIASYMSGILGSMEENLKWYVRFGALFVAVLLTYWDELKKNWAEMLLICAFVLPQIVIYGNVGFSGHYLLPLTIGFAAWFVLWAWNFKPLRRKRRAIYLLGILLLLAANGRVALREADYFRFRGEGITAAFETIYELTQEKEDVKVLSCFDLNSEANSTLHLWLLNRGFDELYFWQEKEAVIAANYDGSTVVKESAEEYEFEEMDIIIAHNREDRHWYFDPSLDFSDFTEIPCGTLTLYVRNNVGLEMPQVEIGGLKVNF